MSKQYVGDRGGHFCVGRVTTGARWAFSRLVLPSKGWSFFFSARQHWYGAKLYTTPPPPSVKISFRKSGGGVYKEGGGVQDSCCRGKFQIVHPHPLPERCLIFALLYIACMWILVTLLIFILLAGRRYVLQEGAYSVYPS